MLAQHFLHFMDDMLNPTNVFIAQANFFFNTAVIHTSWILDGRGRKKRIGNKKRSPVECTNLRVIPANTLHRSLEG